MKLVTSLCLVTLLFTTLNATPQDENVISLAKELNLYAGTKAKIQWKRIFTSQRHMERYHINTLSDEDRALLMKFLILHAADSEQPIVPGL